MSIIQNLLFDFLVSLFHCQYNFDVIKSILAAISYQTVILSDLPKFRNKSCNRSKWILFLSLVMGYGAYLLPAAGLTGFVILFKTNSILCLPLEASFLFNNSADLALETTFTDLYRDRKQHGRMVRARFNKGNSGTRLRMPLNNITDFIAQFNYAGYHDICNYPEKNELFRSEMKSKYPKEFQYHYPGYIWKNSTGTSFKFLSSYYMNHIT